MTVRDKRVMVFVIAVAVSLNFCVILGYTLLQSEEDRSLGECREDEHLLYARKVKNFPSYFHQQMLTLSHWKTFPLLVDLSLSNNAVYTRVLHWMTKMNPQYFLPASRSSGSVDLHLYIVCIYSLSFFYYSPFLW